MQGYAVLEAAEEGLALGVGGLLEHRPRGELHGPVDHGVSLDDVERLSP